MISQNHNSVDFHSGIRIADLFCGAGGAAVGYHRAGFDVVGIDIEPMPHYPFEFHQADALEYCAAHGREFDVIHASPPCQHYSRATAWRGDRDNHPDLIARAQGVLHKTGRLYIIENVEDARRLLGLSVMLCGTAFGLPFRRHRYFGLSWRPALLVPPCSHRNTDFSFDHGGKQPESEYAKAIGCDWMTVQESRQAIPPCYTEWIGKQLISALERNHA